MAWEGNTQIMLTAHLATHVKSISTLMCNGVLFSPEQDLDSRESTSLGRDNPVARIDNITQT
jgi:hypothetical protein